MAVSVEAEKRAENTGYTAFMYNHPKEPGPYLTAIENQAYGRGWERARLATVAMVMVSRVNSTIN